MVMEYQELIVKENESLILNCMLTDGKTKVVRIDGIEVSASIRGLSGILVSELLVEITDTSLGQFTCKLATGNLPANTYLVDIKYKHTGSGLEVPTTTFKLIVTKGITQ